jgi:hypothetical protein
MSHGKSKAAFTSRDRINHLSHRKEEIFFPGEKKAKKNEMDLNDLLWPLSSRPFSNQLFAGRFFWFWDHVFLISSRWVGGGGGVGRFGVRN